MNGAVHSVQNQFVLSVTLISLAVASALIGCAISAYFADRVADRWSRVPAVPVGSALFLPNAIGAGLSFSVWDLVAWRVLGGLGIRIASAIAPAYLAEISPKQLRGRLGSLHQPTITLGIFAALLSDTIFVSTAGTASKTFWLGLEASRWTFFCSLPAQSARSLTLLEQFVDDRRTCVAHSE